ncbi:ornithine carbamoyltransferase [Asticcacaulis excentricus]|uniref:Ornithine carbamoyltransferase, catabolic n=1 Tax=Asticcacaulis excentricus (strain ATCC 15261 / DSM 4724 / KCTC 12464 / NCIMB 9791 / VKM B-1370 / CB 48) TaxID=573065 RepID=E8RQV2_ASTEC|nr:ornithine carbamoyltransferase [Asticcacaulis excentricus]ADU12215.1 ornithine carbamoyltransferase [Asticcacaulis excentricus CB 48]
MVKHFLDISDLSATDLRAILDDAHARKKARLGWPKGRVDADAPAQDRVLAMIFEKNSTRTRFSFDAAIRQLGGDAIISTATDMQLGRGETIEDTAKVLSRMVDAIMIRANRHEDVERLARAASVPVINGLTNKSHPCQILADLQTIEEHRGDIKGKTLAWVGDGNNVCASFIHAAARFDFTLNIACPAKYKPSNADMVFAAESRARVTVTQDPEAAVRGADVVMADTWVSMGDLDHEERLEAFEPYQVNEALMKLAGPDALFLHCLPAHRGEEVTDGVIDGPQSQVWDEAENRIHAQKAVLAWCLNA